MNDLTIYQQPHFGINDMKAMALAIAGSKLFGIQNNDQALALCLIAQAEGRHPASAASDYHIISGRPSKKADAMLRDFLGAGGKVEWHDLTDDIADATFSHPMGGKVRISWDHARVKKAGIANAMHSKYPRAMLRARTVSEGVRTVFPAATSGMYVPDEVETFEPIRDVTPKAEPARIAQPKPEPERTPFDSEAAPEPNDPTPFDDGLTPEPFDAAAWARGWRTLIGAVIDDEGKDALRTAWKSPENVAAYGSAGNADPDLAKAVKGEVSAAVRK